MAPRLFVGLVITSLVGSLCAQAETPKPANSKPATQEPKTPETKSPEAKTPDAKTQGDGKQGEAKQDPDRPVPTAAERVTVLQGDKERLTKEIDFVRTQVKKTIPMLQDKLKMQRPTFRSIDAGTSFQAAPVAEMRKARLMTEEEKKPIANALMTIGGRPVSREFVNDMLAYLKTYPSSGPDEMQMQKVMWEVIRTEAVRASFGESVSEAESEISTMYSQLQDGKAKFEDLAKQRPQGLGGEQGGVIEPVTRNSQHGLRVEQVAFTTPEGKISRPFTTMRGFAILRNNKVLAGATPDETKVDVSMIFVPFNADPEQVNKALSMVTMGNVDIAVADEGAMKMLPLFFQPQPAQTPDAGNVDAETQKKLDAMKKAKGDANKQPTDADQSAQQKLDAAKKAAEEAAKKGDKAKQDAGKGN